MRILAAWGVKPELDLAGGDGPCSLCGQTHTHTQRLRLHTDRPETHIHTVHLDTDLDTRTPRDPQKVHSHTEKHTNPGTHTHTHTDLSHKSAASLRGAGSSRTAQTRGAVRTCWSQATVCVSVCVCVCLCVCGCVSGCRAQHEGLTTAAQYRASVAGRWEREKLTAWL